MFWGLAAVLTLFVAWVVLRPMVQTQDMERAPQSADIAVYRDQLSAVDRDLARGLVSPEEADRLRLEIKRRILDADRAAHSLQGEARAPRGVSTAASVTAALGLLIGALALYQFLGAPGYPDLPLKDRLAAAAIAKQERPTQAQAEATAPPVEETEPEPELALLLDRLRQAVAARPDDLRGHELLSQYEARLGRFKEAYIAQAGVVQIKGDDATGDDFALLADLMVLAAGGFVSPEAEVALNVALERTPGHPSARYYLGLMHAQTGRHDLAFNTWARLLNQSEPQDPWVPAIRGQIMDQAIRAGVDYELPAEGSRPFGPTAGDIDAAADMTQAERMEMIEGMVSGLSDRLATEGGTPNEWARLIRALGVLGRHDQAFAIYTEGQKVFAGNSEALVTLKAAAQDANIEQ